MSRDPIKIVLSRASKVPAMQKFLDNIERYIINDIDNLDIKQSDKKLLRTHFDRVKNSKRQAAINEWLADAVKSMPISTAPTHASFDVFVYAGPPTTYNGLEVPSGTVVTEGDGWIRFDFYRIKKTHDTSSIMSQCNPVGSMNINEVNRYIQDSINKRHGAFISQDLGIRFNRLA